MKLDFLLAVAFAGILATYFHLVFALIADRVGLPKLDLAKGTGKLIFGDSYSGDPPYALSLIAVHMNGVVFSLLYATAFAPNVEGPAVLRGLAYSVLLFFYSQCVHVPIFMKGGFFSSKVNSRAWLTAAGAHMLFGVILGWLSPTL